MYPTTDTSKDGDSASIEDEISKELNEMKKPAKGTRMFEAVIPDMPCGKSCIYPMLYQVSADSAYSEGVDFPRCQALRIRPSIP